VQYDISEKADINGSSWRLAAVSQYIQLKHDSGVYLDILTSYDVSTQS
jgi:hypothetical protein